MQLVLPLKKLLTLALILAFSNPVFADEGKPETEQSKQNNKLKQAIIGAAVIGGVALVGGGGYKLYKFMGEASRALARRSRMLLSTKNKITDPPLYRITAPDGSQHHILGTFHVANLSLSDFPKDSELFKIFNDANILMPERVLTPFNEYKGMLFAIPSGLKAGLRLKIRKLRHGRSLPLSEELGELHWAKLTQMLEEKPDLKPFEQTIDEFMKEIDELTPDQAYNRLMEYGGSYAVPYGNLHMDGQLVRLGVKEGKELIGLETAGQLFSKKALHASRIEPHGIDDLKSLIDKGGIDYVADNSEKIFRLYATGKDIEAIKIWNDTFGDLHLDGADAFHDYMLDQRNIAWVKSGKIQKNCVSGNKCLIFVGDAHLVDGKNTLIKLLEDQRYRIERISAKPSDFQITEQAS